ncbi:hypothetical protein Acsp04_27890 [Actinomadura sp. NBRC 104425]|uniref:hypothetical protein n=1 Tax=Actinomadura sp. NBRC 104425 TaxID=3032204 RepID=UPI0024A17D61|nr:hypothetical protein [Actinomadura sp. NBRC 104425]GLZ12554.1 hypothetical protein Acsp04_27890 [Actinomadura sp. NBRC 104425]
MNEVTNSQPVDDSDTRPLAERVTAMSSALVSALDARGLVGRVLALGVVLTINPAGDPEGDDPRTRVMSPGLRQEVRCLPNPDDGGVLWWYWAWAGPTRQSPPDLEPLCPAADAALAADRIAKVLEVPSAADAASHGGPRDDG